MSSAMITTTLQAAALAGLSNVLAQVISAYQSKKPFAIDLVPLARFVLWAIISTPPNVYWQAYLERSFPSNAIDEKGQRRLKKVNTLKKFLLDQAVGSPINNAAFLAGMNTLKGKNLAQTQRIIQQDFWPLIKSGWKLWPMVSVLNFTVVPADKRILFGSCIGLFWGIYLSLLAAS